ncbi:MAG: YIP1 family protein [Anaerolineae bacterium]|nr:YIP1 family protein [Anaerolineae bacterium]
MEKEAIVVKRNVLGLVAEVFVRPKMTFAYLKDNHKRSWWLPAILSLLLSIAPVFVVSQIQSATSFPMEPEMSGYNGAVEVRAGMMEAGMMDAPSQPVSSAPNLFQLAGTALDVPLGWLVWGGTLYLASVFLGRSSSFGQMFRLAVWTWLPYALRGLVQTIYIFASGEPIVNAGLSGFVIDKRISSIIPPGPGQLALANVLGRVDIYTIWHLFLVSVGLMAFTNLTRRRSLSTAFVIWAVLALLGVVPAIFGSMFQSIG